MKRYQQVDLPGDVTQFVRGKGLRAPLLLLAGLAASAAQTAEPLWPVSRPLSVSCSFALDVCLHCCTMLPVSRTSQAFAVPSCWTWT